MRWVDELIDSQSHKFNVSGPNHLLQVDWGNSGHRRSVVACLVQGVYVAERDRQKSRRAHEASAPEWWESFHFKVIKLLIDDADSSVFGAVYQFNPPTATITPNAPKYVIAFRGTLLRCSTFRQDIELDASLCARRFNPTTRFPLALDAVCGCVNDGEHSNIWLAGHSLGSSIATLVGKNMASKGVFLESFLFNPPFPSIPFHIFNIDEELKQQIHIFHSSFTALVTGVVNVLVGEAESEDSFANLSQWVPSLFVSKADVICSGYVEYFQGRETGNVATQNSAVASTWRLFGRDADPVHLLPSANLNFHGSPSKKILKIYTAHRLRQWWQPDLQLQHAEYRYEHRNANLRK